MKFNTSDELLIFWLISLAVGLPIAAALVFVFDWWVPAIITMWGCCIAATITAFVRQDRRIKRDDRRHAEAMREFENWLAGTTQQEKPCGPSLERNRDGR